MSRHRNIRQLGIDDLSYYDDALASSVDDDYAISPHTASMFTSKGSMYTMHFEEQEASNAASRNQQYMFSADDFPANDYISPDLSPGLVSGRIRSNQSDSFNRTGGENEPVFGDPELNKPMIDGSEASVLTGTNPIFLDSSTQLTASFAALDELDFDSLGTITCNAFNIQSMAISSSLCPSSTEVRTDHLNTQIFSTSFINNLRCHSFLYKETHAPLNSEQMPVSSNLLHNAHSNVHGLHPNSVLGSQLCSDRKIRDHTFFNAPDLISTTAMSEIALRSRSSLLLSLLVSGDCSFKPFLFDVPEPVILERRPKLTRKQETLTPSNSERKSLPRVKNHPTHSSQWKQNIRTEAEPTVLSRDFSDKLDLTDERSEKVTPRPVVSVAQPSASPMKPVDRRALLAEYADQRQGCREKEVINLIVLGHVDAGKSTLMGNLLVQLGHVSGKQMSKYRWEAQKLGKASFAYAWVLDQTSEERTRGVTIDIAQTAFETKTKRIALMDAPGHKDFIPRVIGGASQADVALLVVNATNGEFETGFGAGGQTREHARLARLLGISRVVVAVNKMDTVGWSKDRFQAIETQMNHFLKSLSLTSAIFCPVSGLTGVNLLPTRESLPGKEVDSDGVSKLTSWYNGPCLIDIIDSLPNPERAIDSPLRFVVTDIFKPVGLGIPAVAGRVISGAVSAGVGLPTSRVICQPSSVPAIVKSIRSLCTTRTGSESSEGDASANFLDQSVKYAFAGDQVALILTGVDPFQSLACGDLITDPDNPVPQASRINAKILLFSVPQPITRGSPVIFHHHCTGVPAHISKLKSMTYKENKLEKTKRKPRCLIGNCTAEVEITLERAVCLEVYDKCKPLGRFMLRVGGESVAGGTVTDILPPRKNRLNDL